MNEELKKCPFCGKIPNYYTSAEHDFIGGWSKEAILECCVEMKITFGSYPESKRTEEQEKEILFEKWNSRIE